MPDLPTACDALAAWARGNCASCHGETDYMDAPLTHTCRKYIELARDVGMAVWTECCEEVTGDTEPLGAVWAELDRLLGEPPDG